MSGHKFHSNCTKISDLYENIYNKHKDNDM